MKIFGQLAVRIVVLAAVLGAAGRALAERPADRLVATRPGPLYGTPDGGEGELLAFDARVAPALASLAAGERIAVDGWPVAPGVARTMVLTRTEVYAPDARIVAIGPGGEVEIARSKWAFFLGRDVSGSARVAFALDSDTGAMRGLTLSERGTFELASPTAWSGSRHRLAAPEARDADGMPRRWECGQEQVPLESVEPLPSAPPAPPAPAAREPLTGRMPLAAFTKYAVVAIDTDNEFMGTKFADNTTSATNYIATLFNLMNLIYERDVQLHLLQGYTILRLSSVTDPYVQNANGSANSAELSEFRSYWSTHYGGVKRMVAALLSGKQPLSNSASGIARLGGLCSTGVGYSFSKVFKYSGDTTPNDVLITAHEIGHNFGSPHTHCYSPVADVCFSGECYVGATSCPGLQVYNGHTSNGTLMSYCHLLGCPGGDTLVFHPRTLSEYFNSNIAGASSCIFNGAAVPTGPSVSGIVPPTGSTAGGTSVTINGSGFVSGATAAFIDLTGSISLASVTRVNAGQLTAVTPAHAAGVMDVVVFNPDNSTGTLRNGYTYSVAGTLGTPAVTFPTNNSTLTTSTQMLVWTAVSGAQTYEVLLTDVAAGNKAELHITVPDLSTIYSLHSSTQYQLKVRACQAVCGAWSPTVTFAVSLPAVPTAAPGITGCSVSGGNSLTCNWNAVARADLYQFYVIQPNAGPGGGALTVAARVVSATTVTLPVPAGVADAIVAACNGDGCGPFSSAARINPAGPNPAAPSLGTPLGGSIVAGPAVFFSWNRVPGDNGSNTLYRLFVQDLSRTATALDVYTTQNFWSAVFMAEGSRYDGLVIANPGPSQVQGPAQGFNVSGVSASAPTMVSPAHQSSVKAGSVLVMWTPVPGAGLYQYYLAPLVGGVVTGVTPGLFAQVTLGTVGGAPTLYNGIARACPSGLTCTAASDTGWGPWSNAPGGPGITSFTVTP